MGDETLDFPRIYEAYHGRVVAYAARLLGQDEADDIAQEVFVKIRRSLSTVEDPSKLTSWIYTITLNTVRDAARKQRPERAQRNDEGDTVSRLPSLDSRTPEETAIRNEMVACYLDYVRQLPARYYEMYVLSEFEGSATRRSRAACPSPWGRSRSGCTGPAPGSTKSSAVTASATTTSAES